MARVLDTASVRVEVDTRRGERDARDAGEDYGRAYAKGAQRGTDRTPITPKINPVDAAFEQRLRTQIRQIAARVATDIPLTARGETFRQQVAARIAEVQRGLKMDVPTDPKLAADFRRKLQRMLDGESRRVRARVNFGVDVDHDRITRSLSTLAGLFGRTGEKISDVASTSFAPVSKVLGSFNTSLSSIIITIASASVVAPALAAGLNILGGSAVAAFGAITAGAAGLPVLLSTLIAPIAAIALGMDGIKRAAEPLRDEFKSLKDSVNIAFELGMRPVFEKLQALFPTLNVGLAEVARSVVRVASDFAGIATSASGIENIRVALGGVTDAIDRARPGLSVLFTSLLNVAGTAPLYDILGDTIGGVAERFGNMIERVRASGDLEGALGQLRDVLFSVTDLILELAEGSVKFFKSAGPGLRSFFESLTATLSRIDWSSLGEAFGSMMERIGNAIERVPPEKWRELGDAVSNLSGIFMKWVESGGIEKLITSISTISNILGFFSGNLLRVMNVIGDGIEMFSGFGESVGGLAEKIGNGLGGIPDAFDKTVGGLPGKTTEALTGVTESVDINLGGLPDKVGGFMDMVGEKMSGGWQTVSDNTETAFAGFGEKVDGFFSTLPDRIGYWIGFAGGTAFVKSQEAVEGITGWFAQLPNRLESLAVEMATRTIQVFTQLPGQLGSLATSAVSSVINIIQTLPGRAAAFASETVLRIVGFFQSLPGRAAEFATGTVTTFLGVLGSLPQKAGDLARRMVDDVVRFFKELPGKLWQAGKDAIQGFIDGVKAKAQSVVDAAKSVVSGAIRGAHDAIRSGSPSKVFRDIGKDTIQGYIIGLRDRMAPMMEQIRAMFTQAAQAASVALQGTGVDLGQVFGGTGAFGNVIEQTLGVASAAGFNPDDLTAALGQLKLTAQFDGPNVIQLVATGQRELARR